MGIRLERTQLKVSLRLPEDTEGSSGRSHIDSDYSERFLQQNHHFSMRCSP